MPRLDPSDYEVGSPEWREACEQHDFMQDLEAEEIATAAGHHDDWKPVCDHYDERKEAHERGETWSPFD